MRKLAIIGAGYSGTLLAANILRLGGGESFHIQLIDQVPRMGRGLAYRTWDDNHLLNVPAGNMSAFADAPDDFVQFCHAEDPALGPASFISRRLYGDYLEAILQRALQAHGSSLELVPHAAVAAHRRETAPGWRIEFANRAAVECDRLVLCLGHQAPLDPPPASWLQDSEAYIRNPWDAAALDAIGSDERVMIIGSGHTAVDIAFWLSGHNDQRRIHMVSRRGLSPQGHRPQTRARPDAEFPAYLRDCPPTALAYSRAIRREVRERAAQHQDWRDVIGQLRPHTASLWQRLPVAEQRRFLRHLLPYWDIHRHRLAPIAHGRFSRLRESGQVQTLAGRILSYQRQPQGLLVHLLERGTRRQVQLAVDRVINCAGPNYDLTKVQTPLLQQLLRDGHIQQDALKIGLQVSAQYEVCNRSGEPSPELFYVGPMLKARYWEAIAAPELRQHTRRLAELLLGGL
ncbi:Uncharacterized NAD(P)/FAD-binding protein YdhS [Solimonas aquatica]|uniref:Uncharacterized NAD(P)/FAD-binding protein YdhS n=1 Tax=Solimonas aquatica TaxID=489703 RepID=A0A1H9FQA3_9GAMM|nr:FAD/NAD(P)-binding protein [Solimonas aquatica]SEQ39663.1 Uncharacterized NAD(P)/FAD-binding protein YdhS [Solimonas aquatica]